MTVTLRIVCTNGGTHGPRDLGLVHWTPARLPAVWSADSGLADLKPSALRQSGRVTSAGKWKTTTRTEVTVTTRADGGTTFTFPPCPSCRRPAVSLRDDTLTEWAGAGDRVADVSLVP